MVKTNDRAPGGKYYINKVDGEEVYQVIDTETDEVKAEFPTRREAAAELKALLNPTDEPKKKAADEEEDEGDHEYR